MVLKLGLVFLFFVTFQNCGKNAAAPKLNTDPVINSAGPSASSVLPGDTVLLAVDAVDADGDPLTITWTDSAGQSLGTGPTVSWVAPNTQGTHTLSVEAKDLSGGKTTKTVSVFVDSSGSPPPVNSAPVITSLIATPEEIPMGGNVVLKAGSFDPDGDTLTFTWDAMGGVTGTGQEVVWKAPEGAP